MISFFQAPVRNKVPCGIFSLDSIYRYIRSEPKLKEITRVVRSEQPHPDVFKLKKLTLLPYVSPGGIFSRCCRSGLLVPSGDFVVDLDGLSSPEEAARLRDTLACDAMLQPDLVFVSPSGRGVKLFLPYRIDPDRPLQACFSEAIHSSWSYLEALYGLQPDRANSDLCRGCLLCHDADAKRFEALRP